MLDKAKALALSLASKAPLPAGIVIGYACHPIIKLALDAAAIFVRHILG